MLRCGVMPADRRRAGFAARGTEAVLSLSMVLAIISDGRTTGRCRAEDPADVLSGDLTALIDAAAVEKLSTPMRKRDPHGCWLDRAVCQRKGIVVEDPDYIVRERYYILDTGAVGRVVEVKDTDVGTRCIVLFPDETGWDPKGFEKAPEKEKRVTVKRDAYGNIEEVLTVTSRIEGLAIDRQRCGLILRREGRAVYVEFPENLLSFELPRINDRVVRGPDWQDGFADGLAVPFGRVTGPIPENAHGVVVKERDQSRGFVEIRWPLTGRVTAHRFDDAAGFFDVEKVASERLRREPAPPDEPAGEPPAGK